MFNACMPALITPMLLDGAVDYPAFERLVKRQLEGGVDGLVVLGTTAESPTLIPEEKEKLVSMAVAITAGQVPVIVGTGTNATRTTVAASQKMQRLGADACLIVGPYYNRPTHEGVFQHVKAANDALDIPIMVYNHPGRTGCDIVPALAARLATLDHVVAIKDASGDLARVAPLKATGLQVFSGDDAQAVELIQRGGDGLISVACNLVPAMMTELCHEALNGGQALATAIHQKLIPLFAALNCESNPIPLKWAMAHEGLIQGGIRLPLTELAAPFHPQVEAAIFSAKNA